MSKQLALFAAQWDHPSKTLWTFGEFAVEREGDRYVVYRGRKLLTKPFAALKPAQLYVEGIAQRDTVQP